MPSLYPTSSTSSLVLPATASSSEVDTATYPLPFGIYTSSEFKEGCADQVAYVYRKMAGDVLDLEITKYDVFAAYEDAVLTYSYLVNLYQARNALNSALGSKTGSFDSDGELSGSTTGILHAELKYPRLNFGYIRNIAGTFSEEAGVGGHHTVHTSSIDITDYVQEYDLQKSLQDSTIFSGSVSGKKVLIKKVFYKTGRAFWSLYGMYGGINIIGSFANFNSYASDQTFEIMPVWEMKQRVMELEDRMWTRTSHFSYELRNNILKLYPTPSGGTPTKIYFEFIIPDEGPWTETSGSVYSSSTISGVNSINTLPFSNIPYENINSIGKQFIRSYALESCKETLGMVRGKFSTIPIPNENITMNGPELIANARETKEKLKDDLLKTLEETQYFSLSKKDAEMAEDVNKILQKIPLGIYVG
jgi:hypothetical protein